MPRPEVTGRKSGRVTARPFTTAPADPADCMTIREFCIRHRLSAAKFFEMKRLGQTPDEIHYGRAVRISREAAERWRRQREKLAATARGNEAHP